MEKRKDAMKANMGKLLETVSPAYSAMKGKGPISDVLSKWEWVWRRGRYVG